MIRIKSTWLSLVWILCGGSIISFTYVNAYLSDVSLFQVNLTALTLSPMLVGFVIGVLLSDETMKLVLWAVFGAIATAMLLISITYASPLYVTHLEVAGEYAGWIGKDLGIASIFMIPTAIIGGVMGMLMGETFFVGESERKVLSEETREWHQILEQVLEKKRVDDRREEMEDIIRYESGSEPDSEAYAYGEYLKSRNREEAEEESLDGKEIG